MILGEVATRYEALPEQDMTKNHVSWFLDKLVSFAQIAAGDPKIRQRIRGILSKIDAQDGWKDYKDEDRMREITKKITTLEGLTM